MTTPQTTTEDKKNILSGVQQNYQESKNGDHFWAWAVSTPKGPSVFLTSEVLKYTIHGIHNLQSSKKLLTSFTWSSIMVAMMLNNKFPTLGEKYPSSYREAVGHWVRAPRISAKFSHLSSPKALLEGAVSTQVLNSSPLPVAESSCQAWFLKISIFQAIYLVFSLQDRQGPIIYSEIVSCSLNTEYLEPCV